MSVQTFQPISESTEEVSLCTSNRDLHKFIRHCIIPEYNRRSCSIILLFQNGTNSTSQYTLHQAKGDAKAGDWRDGYLLKRSEGRLRNVWQRRRCEVRDGFLKISHADESKTPSQVNLLTCQMKPVLEDRLCFDVVSYNR